LITAHPFTGPLKDNTGVERVKAGEVFPLTDLGKMNWLVEGVVGQPR
jgi:basic membrane protein A and related proteins